MEQIANAQTTLFEYVTTLFEKYILRLPSPESTTVNSDGN